LVHVVLKIIKWFFGHNQFNSFFFLKKKNLLSSSILSIFINFAFSLEKGHKIDVKIKLKNIVFEKGELINQFC